ncbi:MULTISPECIES: hypothetical protein [unclassified Gilliamella]|uniref:hypothetical protein n=1 Tax=unclassified Gilliamella TaxID=2685620 RepID=UPI0013223990|nr:MULTISPECIES: hypothetical protein [unclassified Gilliamella]MWN30965.1 hypothetical protein [Gilliamella sp. Pra-s60]MWP28470.1 hypothetical protein [Gilliamella sp. Pra-s54]
MDKQEIIKKCIESYSRLKNLKLVGLEVGIPWQTVYVYLKREGIAVTGDKARYGSATDRIAIIGEQRFYKAVPFAIDNNNLQFQASVDFSVFNLTVDVKTSKLQHKKINTRSSDRWAYCINKQKDIADLFVFYALNDELETEHVFLMPNEIVTNATTISIPKSGKSKWFDYKVNENELAGFFKQLAA